MKYSQHNEEEFLKDYFGDETDGFCVEIGANDGIKGSNTRALWERGWNTVMVEGSLGSFQAMLQNYNGKPRMRMIWAAVCDYNGVATFYEHKKIQLCGWNSMDESFIKAMGIDQYQPTLVPAVRIGDLGLPNEFDFLSVDTEGNDFLILSAMPTMMRPTLIMAEIDKHDNASKIDALLTGRGYSRVWVDEIDEANAAYSL